MRFPIAWLLAAAVACGGPRLEQKTVTSRIFAGAERCGQHLVETRFTATGHRHGEAVVLRSCGPRDLAVVMSIEVQTVNGPMSLGLPWGDEADNQRCLARPGQVAGAASGGGGDVEAAGEPKGLASEPARASLVEVAETGATRDACFATSSFELAAGRLVAGSPIVVKLWSKEPSDLESALIRIRHVELHPNVSDKEWAEHVARRAKQRDAEPAPAHHDPVPGEPPPPPRAERRPPRPGPAWAWVPGYWSYRAGEWVWVRGAWKDDDSARRPPPPKEERRPRKPPGASVWIAGSWFWNGARFVWSPGRWVIRDRRR